MVKKQIQIYLQERIQELLEQAQQVTKIKEAKPILALLEEHLHNLQQEHLSKEETLQIQINQLQQEVQRLSHL